MKTEGVSVLCFLQSFFKVLGAPSGCGHVFRALLSAGGAGRVFLLGIFKLQTVRAVFGRRWCSSSRVLGCRSRVSDDSVFREEVFSRAPECFLGRGRDGRLSRGSCTRAPECFG